jgi:hypothetical protein
MKQHKKTAIGNVHGMEGESVDRVNGVGAVDLLTMGFERILFCLHAWRGIEEFDRNTALNRRARIGYEMGTVRCCGFCR